MNLGGAAAGLAATEDLDRDVRDEINMKPTQVARGAPLGAHEAAKLIGTGQSHNTACAARRKMKIEL